MNFQHKGDGDSLQYGFQGVNSSSPPIPKVPIPMDFPWEGESDLNIRRGMIQYLIAGPSEQQVKMPWCFHLVGDHGREARREDDGRVDQETQESKKKNGGGHTKLCSRGHWRPYEDAKLKELVCQYGPQNWNLIAEKLEGRSGKSCRLRWFNQLDPRINKMAFSEEEEERLLAAHRMYGNKWAMIARLFPGRTDNAVKNHWHVIIARKQREENSVYRRRKPSSFQAYHKGFTVNTLQNSACNGSDVSTNNREESASTCTDLSLTPSSNRVSPGYFTSSVSAEKYHFLGPDLNQAASSGDERKVMKTRGAVQYCQLNNNGPIAKATVTINPSAQSDSSSELSASESVANNASTRLLLLNDKIENGIESYKLPFIDFLGVGARK
ncbi:uncharacterized protein [Coffea arabica]|uniref:Uncharacterized protein n=1 Tax=Coffea arabica TaxID=13443 RepID=A0A6P6SXP7_COFAR|nr:transcription factor CSA-like [Coffea arabica]